MSLEKKRRTIEVQVHDTKELHPKFHELFCDKCKVEPLGEGYEKFKQIGLELKEKYYRKIERI